MQGYILLHRRLDDEAANAGRAAVYEPLADCQLLFRKRDDLLIAVPQCGFMRYRPAYRSRDGTVRIKTKRGGSLVNVDRVMPLLPLARKRSEDSPQPSPQLLRRVQGRSGCLQGRHTYFDVLPFHPVYPMA